MLKKYLILFILSLFIISCQIHKNYYYEKKEFEFLVNDIVRVIDPKEYTYLKEGRIIDIFTTATGTIWCNIKIKGDDISVYMVNSKSLIPISRKISK